jgi:serine/threonine protein kinase
MATYLHGSNQVQRPSSGNPWGAFLPHWSLEGYKDPPTDGLTLQNALSAWKRMFGSQQLTLDIRDPVPLEQGAILGSGGLGAVYETKIDGIAVAWKRVYTRKLTERHLNEVKILGHMTERRHKHIVNLIGSYTHRQRNSTFELAILTWPVARCDLSVLMREIDMINDWKSRDETWEEDDWATQPSDEEKTAFENLLQIERLEQDRSNTFTWHLRERALSATLQRLTRSIGCIAEAVRYLHDNGIRHKDIKPHQILISSDGLWLTDFGWSKDISQLTSSETSGGDTITIRYHAPERAQKKSCGRAEDVFSLGCTFLEMSFRICGRRAKDYLNPAGSSMWSFQANLDSLSFWLTHLRSERSALQAYFGGIIERMMTYEAHARPTICEVIEDLRFHSRYNSDSVFGQCCAPHKPLQIADIVSTMSDDEDSIGSGSESKPQQNQPWSLSQLLQSLETHDETHAQRFEDSASTTVAYSDNHDHSKYDEPEAYVEVEEEGNRVEAPITRIIRILHDVQSMPYSAYVGGSSSTFSDGTAFQCICGKPDVSAEDIQCTQCNSWQHANCYYAPAEHRPSSHECLMCNSKASITVPYRAESPPRLRPSKIDIFTRPVDKNDPHLLRWLKDTARNTNDRESLVMKAGISQARNPTNTSSYHDGSLKLSGTRSRDDLHTRTSLPRADHQLTHDEYAIKGEVCDIIKRTLTRAETLYTITEPWTPLSLQNNDSWTPLSQQDDKLLPHPGASVYTSHGPRASTPQVPIHPLRSGVSAHRDNIRATFRRHGDWPDDRTADQARTPDMSTGVRQNQYPSYSLNHSNRTNPFLNTHRAVRERNMRSRQNDSMS